MIDERVCLESPVFPIIVTVTLLVEYQRDRGAVYRYIFPFTGEDMAVTGLRHHRWRKGIHGNSPMNRRLAQDAASNAQAKRRVAPTYHRSMLVCQLVSVLSLIIW
jgi:hypothetical protein